MGQRVRCITISMRRVSDLGVDNFLHPANTLCSQKEEILRIFDKTLFLGAKRTPPEGWFHEPRSEAESALRKRNLRTHMHPKLNDRSEARSRKKNERRVRFEKEIYAHTCTRSLTTEAKRGHEKRTSGECAAKKKPHAHTCAHM